MIFLSCEREVDNLKYPEFRQKLVVFGYLSPGNKRNYVSVSSNFNIYGGLYTNPNLGNITATISDGTKEIALDTNSPGFGFNSSDLSIIEGMTYKLKINNDFGLSAEASCTIPFKRNFKIEIDTSGAVNSSGQYYYVTPTLHFTDFPGENNYYRLLYQTIIYTSKYNIVRNQIGTSEYDYFTDKGIDGKRFTIVLPVLMINEFVDSSFIKVFLMNTDYNYYNYHKSMGNYSSGEDPFTEPSPVYSNITGGLGIFASYTVDSLIFRLK
jgi:hypothetical protein